MELELYRLTELKLMESPQLHFLSTGVTDMSHDVQIPDVGSGGPIQVLLLAKPAFYQLSYLLVQEEDYSVFLRNQVCAG